jgi:hypothetical protein
VGEQNSAGGGAPLEMAVGAGTAPDSNGNSDGTGAAPAGGGPWGQLAAALKQRLSGATYAAWILPAQPLDPNPGTPAEGADGAGEPVAGQRTVVRLALPSAFALDRWRRPPVAPALAEAAAGLGIDVVLEVTAAAGQA